MRGVTVCDDSPHPLQAAIKVSLYTIDGRFMFTGIVPYNHTPLGLKFLSNALKNLHLLSNELVLCYVPQNGFSNTEEINLIERQYQNAILHRQLAQFLRANFLENYAVDFAGVVSSFSELNSIAIKYQADVVFNGITGKVGASGYFYSNQSLYELNEEASWSIINLTDELVNSACFISNHSSPFFGHDELRTVFNHNNKSFVHINSERGREDFENFDVKKKKAERALGFKFDRYEQVITSVPISTIKSLVSKRGLKSLILELEQKYIPNYHEGLNSLFSLCEKKNCAISVIKNLSRNGGGSIQAYGQLA
ncbi:hypothetical protein [Luteibaculum oceani]|uniref:Uncharacterized protein n=1 Tax=Luteibaculum oceani TaxID=1294296 RepID=A0A5C6VJX9_9FLAO|nr:hypothetical protein [Luteibaculum oceani]TXC85330.1 hypothetical protein FRX97_01520 [Luteibaculum oceani]